MSAYDDLVAAPEPRAGIHDELRALEADLAKRQFVGRSANETVVVAVTGDGALVDIAITNAALRGSHPDEVGPAIVQAVHSARAEAGRYARDRTRSVLQPPSPSVTLVDHDDGDGDLFQGFHTRGIL